MNIEKYAKKYRQDSKIEHIIPQMLQKYLQKYHFTTFLDCGCGDGVLLLIILSTSKFLTGKKIFACDLSKIRIKRLQKLQQMFPESKITARVDDAQTLSSFAQNSIDFLVSSQVIEHVDDDAMLKAIRRVLRTGGIAYLTTVYKKKWAWYFYRHQHQWVLDPTHLREYTADSQLTSLIKKHALKIIEQQKTPLVYTLALPFSFLRKIKIPILGYYIWELVVQK